MDIKKIRQIAKILKSEGLEEIELQIGESYLRVKKATEPVVTAVSSLPASVITEKETEVEKAEDVVPEGELILSPLAGTFYRSKSPGAPPFVSVGDTVVLGQTLCILEAMKLMNELESEHSGTIVEVLVKDADPINEGQPLFRIQTDN